MDTSRAYADALDRHDELRGFRERFVIADPELIYLDGNSLGRLPKATQERLRTAVDREWGERLIRGWNEGWYEAAIRVGGKLAELIGAQSEEVIIADSTSVNLYKAAMAAALARPGRPKIITDDLNFPSDVYILKSVAQQTGGRSIQILQSPDGINMPRDILRGALGEDTAFVSLSHTAFKSGFTHDLVEVTRMIHQVGALAIWDMSHSVGAVQISLNEAEVDLAVGCTYKYLNGGPGAPAFLYVRQDLQPSLVNPITGWFSQKQPFEMDLDYLPAPGMRRYLSGTPPTLSLLAIEPGVDLLREAGMARVRAKSVNQTSYLIGLWQERLEELGFTLMSPSEADDRGGHVALSHEYGLAIDQALIHEAGVIPDFRPPDNIRLGLSPLYTSYAEIHEAVDRMARIVTERRYRLYQGDAPAVI
jgi:kynureninase